ncbi:MAG: hypothetical protein KF791_01555 [Verrucomicrobiae bacterium]|nr:hypothetical protein [Verrucomicrobiae bacterium]
MGLDPSSYYPPRARDRWLPQGFAGPLGWAGIQLCRLYDRLPLATNAGGLTVLQFLLAVLLPGYGYAALGRRRLAGIHFGVWLASALVVLIFLGRAWMTGFALGAMASAHTSGLGYVMLRERAGNPDVPALTLTWRIGLPLALWFLALWIVYLPGLTAFQNQFARPLWVQGRLVIVKPRAGWDLLKPGSVIAYRLTGWRSGEFVFRDGLGLGPVIALAGERVEFLPDGVRVGLRRGPLQPWMPVGAALTVWADAVFVWPQFDVRAIGQSGIAEQIYLDSAKVTRANFIGRPYQRWFFHRQVQP